MADVDEHAQFEHALDNLLAFPGILGRVAGGQNYPPVAGPCKSEGGANDGANHARGATGEGGAVASVELNLL